MITQVDPIEFDNLTLEQISNLKHQSLCFGSGVFRGSQSKWSTIEKEAYAIVACVTKYSYLLQSAKGFELFTDHKNLIYTFSPAKDTKKHISNKLQRWAMKLSNYRYTVHHISGENNVWADLLSRWGLPTHTIKVNRIVF